MDGQGNDSLMHYSNGTKDVCLFTIFSILLILIFIISPLNNFFLASIFGKIVILVLLGLALYKNITTTLYFSKNVPILDGGWSNLKTNILLSYVFSIFIIILIFSVFNRLIR